MPYITQEARRRIEQQGDPQTAGELNYVFTLASIGYLHRKGLSYQTISDVVAAFEVAKGEFIRCVAAPYEQHKRKTNGDVWT